MLDAIRFLQDLRGLGLTRFFGVPDSLLAPLISGLEQQADAGDLRLDITPSEGAAIGLGIGSYLATGDVPVVFMQNSGLGNTVNPLTSLASDQVYGTPMVLLIGWRGEMLDGTQLADEPQHKFQGAATLPMLELLDVPYQQISADMGQEAAQQAAAWAGATALKLNKPVALVVRKGSFAKPPKVAKPPLPQAVLSYPTREAAIDAALQALPSDTPIVGTTGKISREIYELNKVNAAPPPQFLSVGGMGHANMIAAGLAAERPLTKVACFDGDGAILMHAGNLASSAKMANLIHLVFNNQVHDSVGGQTTAAPDVVLSDLARVMGYAASQRVTELDQIKTAITSALTTNTASFIEVMVQPGSRADLGRPAETPQAAKRAFMTALRSE